MQKNLIDDKKPQTTIEKKLCDDFIHGKEKKFIYGINKISEEISSIIRIDAFIDDFTEKTRHNGIPVIKLKEIKENSLILSTITQARPIQLIKKINNHTPKPRQIDYFSFIKNSGLKINPVEYLDKFDEDININIEKYEKIFNSLHDSRSKEEFKKVTNFKYHFDLSYMCDFEMRIQEQYFEDFLKIDENEVFFDVGSYDGLTSIEFIKKSKNKYRNIMIFEPDYKNIKKIESQDFLEERIKIYPIGLSDEKKRVKFISDNYASKICEDGDHEIQLEKLDNISFENPPTFIKMDIEGEELNAIRGAKKTIIKHHPKLAICVYHKPSHTWEIVETIMSYRNDYDLYFRHYTEGLTESVMFFIPKTN